MFHLDLSLRMAHHHLRDIRRAARERPQETYPDRERQPRIWTHWTNRH